MKTSLALLALLLALAACSYVDNRLRVHNGSADSIIVYANFHHPDATLDKAHDYGVIAPRDSGYISLINKKWDDIFERYGDTLTLLYYRYDGTQPRDVDAARGMLKKEVVTRASLNAANWLRRYP